MYSIETEASYSLGSLDHDANVHFNEYFSHQEVISQVYQRLDKSYFQELPEL